MGLKKKLFFQKAPHRETDQQTETPTDIKTEEPHIHGRSCITAVYESVGKAEMLSLFFDRLHFDSTDFSTTGTTVIGKTYQTQPFIFHAIEEWCNLQNTEWLDYISTRKSTKQVNRSFLSSPQPPFQIEAKCEVLVITISFLSY